MKVTTLTTPLPEIFTLEEVRQILDLEADETDRKELIEGFIALALSRAELFTRRRILTQEVELLLTGFPSCIEIPVAPVQSIDSIEYLTDAATWTAVDPLSFWHFAGREPNELAPVSGAVWPTPFEARDNVRIRMTVGYGDDQTAVPSAISQAIKLMVANLYFNRPTPDDKDGCLGVARFLAPYVLWM